MNSPEVVMIGLGYIGLPTAALIASSGTNVLGVDINQNVVDTINAGKIHIVEPSLDVAVANAVKNGFLKASTTPLRANVYLIVVPTQFKGKNEPDISFVEAATRSVLTLLKEGDLYIIESTSPIGTTEKMKDFIYEERPELKDELFIAYCPERVLPGNVMHELVHNDRVIGGVNQKSTDKAIAFYAKHVKGELHATNARTAEMCKLVENSSRDVQIAFANELSLICDKADINVWELINLANKHPRVNILQPGCGVGGHCIGVDPYYLAQKAQEFGYHPEIILAGRRLNDSMGDYVASEVVKLMISKDVRVKDANVLVLGVTFKENCPDVRNTKVVDVIASLKEFGMNITVYDPWAKEEEVLHEYHLNSTQKIPTGKFDAIVLAVAHQEFLELDFDAMLHDNHVIYDVKNILPTTIKDGGL